MTADIGTPRRPRTPKRSGSTRLPGRFACRYLAVVFTSLVVCGPAAAADEIRVGVAAPLSGHKAAVGRALETALEAGISGANAEGGARGATLKLVVADDGCTAAMGDSAATTLIAQKPAVVIGHPCSSSAVTAAARYTEGGPLLIAVGPRHPAVTDANPNPHVLRLAGRDDRQGDAAARWLMGEAQEARIAIVHDRTQYARAIADRARAVLADGGVKPAAEFAVAAGSRDYTETIEKILGARAEAILFAGFVEEAVILIAGMEQQGVRVPILGTDTLATSAFAERVSRLDWPVRILLPAEPRGAATDSDQEDPAGAPQAIASAARGALEAWLATVRRIGTTDAGAVHRAMRGRPIPTKTLGTIRFDEEGEWGGEDFVPAEARGSRWVRER